MGLLDLFGSSWEDPKTAAIFALGQGLLSQRGMPGLLQGAQGYVGTMQAAKERERLLQAEALKQELLRAQIDENKAQTLQRQAAMEEAKRKAEAEAALRMRRESFLANPLAAAGIGGPSIMAGSGQRTPEQNAAVATAAQRPTFNFATAVELYGPEQAAKIMAGMKDARNFGRDEIAAQFDTVMPGTNRPGTGFRSKYDVLPMVQPKAVEMKLEDFGGYKGAVDPFSLTAGQRFDKTMTFADKAAMGNLGVAQQRLAMDRLALDSGATGKAPQGYRFKPDGSLEAIPGGPADIKAGELGDKREREREASVSSTQNVLDTISEAKKLTGWTTAGPGGVAAALPMTDARELAGKLQTIKANLGFDRLQEMRRNSPTGGALGQVAVQELNALQATVASLDQLQSPAALGRALDKAEKHYSRWLEVMGGSTGGASGSIGGTNRAPSVGTVDGGYRFKGGDPADPSNWEKVR